MGEEPSAEEKKSTDFFSTPCYEYVSTYANLFLVVNVVSSFSFIHL